MIRSKADTGAGPLLEIVFGRMPTAAAVTTRFGGRVARIEVGVIARGSPHGRGWQGDCTIQRECLELAQSYLLGLGGSQWLPVSPWDREHEDNKRIARHPIQLRSGR